MNLVTYMTLGCVGFYALDVYVDCSCMMDVNYMYSSIWRYEPNRKGIIRYHRLRGDVRTWEPK